MSDLGEFRRNPRNSDRYTYGKRHTQQHRDGNRKKKHMLERRLGWTRHTKAHLLRNYIQQHNDRCITPEMKRLSEGDLLDLFCEKPTHLGKDMYREVSKVWTDCKLYIIQQQDPAIAEEYAALSADQASVNHRVKQSILSVTADSFVPRQQYQAAPYSDEKQGFDLTSIMSQAGTFKPPQPTTGLVDLPTIQILKRPSNPPPPVVPSLLTGPQIATSFLPQDREGAGGVNDGISMSIGRGRMLNEDTEPVVGMEASGHMQKVSPPVQLRRPDFTKDQVGKSVIEWVPYDPHIHGQFFMNKLMLHYGEEDIRLWQPSDLPSIGTVMLDLDDVLPVHDLNDILIVSSVVIADNFTFLQQLPLNAFVHLVCPVATKPQHMSPTSVTFNLCICLEHGTRSPDSASLCACPDLRQVKITHPSQGERLRANVIILRYTSHVRLAILSSPVTEICWQKLINMGWFIDLPIRTEPSSEVHEVEEDLTAFLHGLSVENPSVLCDVDYSQISPMVQLIHTLPEFRARAPQVDRCGIVKLNRLKHSIPWKVNTDKENVCLTHRVGRSKTVFALEAIFDLPRVAESQMLPHLKVLYPSVDSASLALVAADVEKLDLKTYFEFCDGLLHSDRYLHELPDEDCVLIHANIYLQYQEVLKEVENGGGGDVAGGVLEGEEFEEVGKHREMAEEEQRTEEVLEVGEKVEDEVEVRKIYDEAGEGNSEVGSEVEKVDIEVKRVDSEVEKVGREVDIEVQKVDSEVDIEFQKVDNEVQKVESEVQKVDSEVQKVDSEVKKVDSEVQEVEKVDSDMQKVDSEMNSKFGEVESVNQNVNIEENKIKIEVTHTEIGKMKVAKTKVDLKMDEFDMTSKVLDQKEGEITHKENGKEQDSNVDKVSNMENDVTNNNVTVKEIDDKEQNDGRSVEMLGIVNQKNAKGEELESVTKLVDEWSKVAKEFVDVVKEVGKEMKGGKIGVDNLEMESGNVVDNFENEMQDLESDNVGIEGSDVVGEELKGANNGTLAVDNLEMDQNVVDSCEKERQYLESDNVGMGSDVVEGNIEVDDDERLEAEMEEALQRAMSKDIIASVIAASKVTVELGTTEMDPLEKIGEEEISAAEDSNSGERLETVTEDSEPGDNGEIFLKKDPKPAENEEDAKPAQSEENGIGELIVIDGDEKAVGKEEIVIDEDVKSDAKEVILIEEDQKEIILIDEDGKEIILIEEDAKPAGKVTDTECSISAHVVDEATSNTTTTKNTTTSNDATQKAATEPPGMLGWLVVGSPTLGFGSWGGSLKCGPGEYSFDRFEMAVGIFPELKMDEDTNTLRAHVMDLSAVRLPFVTSDTRPYSNVAVPWVTSDWKDDNFHRYIGKITRIEPQGKFAFVEELPTWSPLSKRFTKFPMDNNRGGNNWRNPPRAQRGNKPLVGFLHRDLLEVHHGGPRAWPGLHSVIEFIGSKQQHRGGGGRGGTGMVKFRVGRIIKLYESVKDAEIAYDVRVPAQGGTRQRHAERMEDEDDMDFGFMEPLPKPVGKETREEGWEKLGIKSEEEEEEYWDKEFTEMSKKIMEKCRQAAREGPSIEPLRIDDEETWFLKHVTSVFDGQLPGAFWGPCSLFALRQRTQAMERAHCGDGGKAGEKRDVWG